MTADSSHRNAPPLDPGFSRRVRVLLILLFFVVSLSSTFHKSFTMDELDNVFSGYRIVHCGDLEFRNVNPPLVRLFVSVPWWFVGSDPQECGDPVAHKESFLRQHASIVVGLHLASKLLVLLLGLLACHAVFGLGRDLFGERTGLFSLLLFAANPTILAHSRIATTDFAFACLVLFTLYYLNRWLQRDQRRDLGLTCLLAGLTVAAKFSGLVLVLLLVFILALKRKPAALGWLLVAVLLVVNGVYGFSGTFQSLGSLRPFHSTRLEAVTGVLPAITPVPLPTQYVRGFDRQMSLNTKHFPQYLNGTWRDHRVPQYYPLALLYKVPLPILLLFLLSLGMCRRSRPFLLLQLPLLTFLVLMSIFSLNLGVRYVLPAVVLLSLSAAYVLNRLPGRAQIVLVGWLVLETAACFPHYLTYFNYALGGPSRGHRYLLDSNLDWGQDLPLLKDFMDDEEIPEIHMIYFGNVPPEFYGIRVTPLATDGKMPRGYYCISANLLYGSPLYFERWQMRFPPADVIEHVRRHGELVTILGNTLYVFAL